VCQFSTDEDCVGSSLAQNEISLILSYVKQSNFQQYFIRRVQHSGLSDLRPRCRLTGDKLLVFVSRVNSILEPEICNAAVNIFPQLFHDA
jgi:hypothetical protein